MNDNNVKWNNRINTVEVWSTMRVPLKNGWKCDKIRKK